MTTARNKNGINVWPSSAIARASAAETEGERIFGRMTIWPNQAQAVSHLEYPVSGGGEEYETGAVHFDDTHPAIINEALATAGDNEFVSYSFWAKFAAPEFPGSPGVFFVDPGGDYSSYDGYSAEASLYIPKFGAPQMIEARGQATLGPWHHILVSVDVSGTHYIKIFVDDVDVTDQVIIGDAAEAILFNGLSFYIGDDGFGSGTPMDLADFWFAPGVSLLNGEGTIPEATRRKFISAEGAPVDLGENGETPTGTAPAIFLRRDPAAAASTFANNLGTGGAFTITGTLTNASTSPSD